MLQLNLPTYKMTKEAPSSVQEIKMLRLGVVDHPEALVNVEGGQGLDTYWYNLVTSYGCPRASSCPGR